MVTLALDPGGTTGFAALDDGGKVLATAALTYLELAGFMEFLSYIEDRQVVIEQGPRWGHHSSVTKNAEAVCNAAFPDATLIPPNRWKKHPAAKVDRVYRHSTQHEKDAVMLGRWFQAQERESVQVSIGADSTRTRRKRN